MLKDILEAFLIMYGSIYLIADIYHFIDDMYGKWKGK